MNIKVASLLLLASVNGYAASEFDVAKAAIMHIQPNLRDSTVNTIVYSLLKNAEIYDLDWKIMASIIAQESSFKRDPQNCLHIRRRCQDLGISQINWDTWGKELKLQRHKLLIDIDYNITTMAQILNKLKETYGHERLWYTRYHSFTMHHRKTYADFIYHKYIKINSYVQGYLDREKQEEIKEELRMAYGIL